MSVQLNKLNCSDIKGTKPKNRVKDELKTIPARRHTNLSKNEQKTLKELKHREILS